MGVAIEAPVEFAVREPAGLLRREHQAVVLTPLELDELFRPERGLGGEVREDLHRLVQVLGERAKHQVHALLVAARVHVGAEELDALGDLGARLPSCSLAEHLRDQVGEPFLPSRVGLGTRADDETQVHHGELVRLDHVELEAVLQRGALDGREVDVARRARGRRGHGGGRRRVSFFDDGALLEGRHLALGQSGPAAREGEEGGERDRTVHRPSSPAAEVGITSSTVRFVAAKYRWATCWTCSRVTAR